MPSTLRRTLVVAGAAAVAVGLLSAPASAHVTANSANATQGGYAKITFQVPTERDNASTVKLRVEFPEADPLATVLVKPKLGWTHRVTKRQLVPPVQQGGRTLTEAVSAVEYTAVGGLLGIKPGEFDDFDILAGSMPTKDSITFRAVQTYSTGEQVVWTPSLRLNPPATAPASAPAGWTQATVDTPQLVPDLSGSDGGTSSGAYVLGGLGVLTGLAGVGLALTRRRSAVPQA